jgi:hypothetical protein
MSGLTFTQKEIVLLQNRYEANVLEVFIGPSGTTWVKFDTGKDVYLDSHTLEER